VNGVVSEWALSNVMKTSMETVGSLAKMAHVVEPLSLLRASRRLESAFIRSRADLGFLFSSSLVFKENSLVNVNHITSQNIQAEPEQRPRCKKLAYFPPQGALTGPLT